MLYRLNDWLWMWMENNYSKISHPIDCMEFFFDFHFMRCGTNSIALQSELIKKNSILIFSPYNTLLVCVCVYWPYIWRQMFCTKEPLNHSELARSKHQQFPCCKFFMLLVPWMDLVRTMHTKSVDFICVCVRRANNDNPLSYQYPTGYYFVTEGKQFANLSSRKVVFGKQIPARCDKVLCFQSPA